MYSAQLDIGLEHIQLQIIYIFYKNYPSKTLFFPFGTLLSAAFSNIHEMLFLTPKIHMLCTFTVMQTNYIAHSCLSTQYKCKYIISQHEAKTHFRTLKMSFQNQSPDDCQPMISIIALLYCGDYNFTISQAAGDPHEQKICS